MNWFKKLFPARASDNVRIEKALDEGLYLAKENETTGVVRRNLAIVIPFKYERIEKLVRKIYMAYRHGNSGDVFNSAGRCLAENVSVAQNDGLFIAFVTKDGQQHLFCRYKQAVILRNCSLISLNDEDGYAVAKSDKYYLFSATGKLFFKSSYPFAKKRLDGIYFSTQDDRGFPISINENGKIREF